MVCRLSVCQRWFAFFAYHFYFVSVLASLHRYRIHLQYCCSRGVISEEGTFSEMLSVHVGRKHAMPSVIISKVVCLQDISSLLFTGCCISAQTSGPPAVQLLRRNNLRRRELLRMLSVFNLFIQTTYQEEGSFQNVQYGHIGSNNAAFTMLLFTCQVLRRQN